MFIHLCLVAQGGNIHLMMQYIHMFAFILSNDVISQSLRNLTPISYLPNLASVRLPLPAPVPTLGWNSSCLSGLGFALRTLVHTPLLGPTDLSRAPDRHGAGSSRGKVRATGERRERGLRRDEATAEEHEAPRGHEAASARPTAAPSGGHAQPLGQRRTWLLLHRTDGR